MRIAAISDTHGDLNLINTIVRESNADAVIHAGDFGFYDDESVSRLSDRELSLHILHSKLSDPQKQLALGLGRDEKETFIREHAPLSQLPAFLAGTEAFDVPVYVVWGNHEDIEVVRKFCSAQYRVRNLNMLHENSSFHLNNLHLFGLGGNLLKSKKLFQHQLAGGAGKIWSTLSQYIELVDTVRTNSVENETRIFVTHVSPGKEPFVSAIAAILGARWQVSGHMGAPHAMVWNEFAIREPDEALALLRDGVANVLDLAEQQAGAATAKQLEFLRSIQDIPTAQTTLGRGRKVPSWFVNLNYLNLPDAGVGYALLDSTDGRIAIETHRHR